MSTLDNALQALYRMAISEVLWTNASPGSSFPAQTISLPGLQDYDFIIITFAYSTGAYPSLSMLSGTNVGENIGANIPGSVVGRRSCTIQSGGIQFAAANRLTTYGGNATTDNGVVIPRSVIAFKLKE